MAIVERNDYGSVVVNNRVLESLIIEELLTMQDRLVMCNKKGKPVKDNRTPLIDPDYYDAVEVVETRKSYKVVFNIITIFGMSISSITDELFTIVDTVFDSLSLRKPDKAVVNIQGVMTKEGAVVKRDIEVEHIYD